MTSPFSRLLLIPLAFAALSSPLPAEDHLLSHWTFDNHLNDSGPAGQHGVVRKLEIPEGPGPATPTFITDGTPSGTAALVFDGRNAADFTQQNAMLRGHETATLSMWVRTSGPSALSTVPTLFNRSLRTGERFDRHRLGMDIDFRSNRNYWRANGFGESSTLRNENGPNIAAHFGNWVHLVATYNRYAADQLRLYTNGVLTDNATSTLFTLLDFDRSSVGAYIQDAVLSNTLLGEVDDVQIYSTQLTDEEVAWMFAHPGQSVADRGLLSHWTFDGHLNDSGPAGQHGVFLRMADDATPPVPTAKTPVFLAEGTPSGRAALVFDGGTVLDITQRNEALRGHSAATLAMSFRTGGNTAQVTAMLFNRSLRTGERFDQHHLGADIDFRLTDGQPRNVLRVNGYGDTTTFRNENVMAITSLLGEWVHVVATFDRDDPVDQVRTYVNGILVDNTNSTQFSLVDFDRSTIGAYLYDADIVNGFQGEFDDVQIYRITLTDEEVAWLYNNPGQVLPKREEPTTPPVGAPLYSTDFGSPAFMQGDLAGQDGWQAIAVHGSVAVVNSGVFRPQSPSGGEHLVEAVSWGEPVQVRHLLRQGGDLNAVWQPFTVDVVATGAAATVQQLFRLDHGGGGGILFGWRGGSAVYAGADGEQSLPGVSLEAGTFYRFVVQARPGSFLDWDATESSGHFDFHLYDMAGALLGSATDVKAAAFTGASPRAGYRDFTIRTEYNQSFAYAYIDSLTMSLDEVPGKTFASWRNEHFTGDELGNPAISGPDAAPAGDGISNLLKFALGLNPRDAARSGLPVVGEAVIEVGGVEATYLTLTFIHPADLAEVDLIVEAATDFTDWDPNAVEPVNTVAEGEWVTRVYRSAEPIAASARGFMRLRVQTH
jgi:hypothetical protein